MQEELSLVQKLAKIRAMSDVVVKGKRGYNYTYADITEILAHITAGMKKYGVTLIPTNGIFPPLSFRLQYFHLNVRCKCKNFDRVCNSRFMDYIANFLICF